MARREGGAALDSYVYVGRHGHLIAFAGAWAAWRGYRIMLAAAAFLLAAFTLISGFSIGGAYLLPSALMLGAFGLSVFVGSGQRKSATPAGRS